ncbi:hypothetical protein BZB76_0936 [Actinomadura pelletieri DSM 43383]|uniref:Uncharacterized protein n=1 Tax=Actinomadura pelletieri DSM 43383 TaxID=1120940 RepID=A0A495QZ90_9ACTN|nr:hypothetical protein [Actinomadura pelletieri]RKS79470.1 hypothetical protein BZB76_0936 [Actinomadura pelletieri DSM 43383]
MSREGIDHALRRLREDRDRISASLLDLDGHEGSRLLEGARLTGETWRRWEDAKSRMTTLWALFDAYQNVLDTATELRERTSRPDAATLIELSGLLAGRSVELPDGEIPLQNRTLLGPSERRVTLDEAVAMMSDTYEFVAGEIAAADAAWTALLLPLEEVEGCWRETARLAHSLDGTRHPELDRVGRELTSLGRVIRTDPLSLVRDGRPDTTRLNRVRAALTSLGDELAGVARMRDEYDELVARVMASIEEIERTERRAREAHATVLTKIHTPNLPAPSRGLGTALRDRLAALERLREAGRWVEMAGRFAELERAADEALERVRGDLRLSAGLLDRRGELRGRLEAYRAKAARLGVVEDERLAKLYDQAHDVLWTAPCDLRQATTMLAEFQRALRVCENETRTRR